MDPLTGAVVILVLMVGFIALHFFRTNKADIANQDAAKVAISGLSVKFTELEKTVNSLHVWIETMDKKCSSIKNVETSDRIKTLEAEVLTLRKDVSHLTPVLTFYFEPKEIRKKTKGNHPRN